MNNRDEYWTTNMTVVVLTKPFRTPENVKITETNIFEKKIVRMMTTIVITETKKVIKIHYELSIQQQSVISSKSIAPR